MENRQGYKKTKLGWIPDEWKLMKLGELLVFKNGLNKGKEFFGRGTPIVNYMDVFRNDGLTKDIIKGCVEVNESELERFNVRKGDVFFTRTSETIEEIGYTACMIEQVDNTVFSGFVLRARPLNNRLSLLFKKYCFSSYSTRKEIMKKSSCTTRALTNGTLLSDVNILVPPLQEQKKIAQILSTWDEAIEKTKQLIKKKKQLKKGLMQQLLTGKIRFGEFEGIEWKTIRAGEVFENYSNKNHTGELQVLSATQDRGVIPRDQLGINIKYDPKSLTNYKLVNKGAFIISLRSFQGGIEFSEHQGLVSPAYTVLKEKQPIISTFYKNYFKTESFIRKLQSIV
jgi:type I restriction enzyme S subunit